MTKCDFCDEFAGGQQNAYAQYYGKLRNRSILVTVRFRVVPTLGQLVEGHLLIVPTEHSCALADLPDDQIQELENLSQDLRGVLRSTYGQCVFFEHGIRTLGSGGCGIDHAHLHAVPLAAEGVLPVLKDRFGGCGLQSLKEIRRAVPQDSSYLFFEDSSQRRHAFAVEHLPSQYLRKLIAQEIGKADWDWRQCGYEPELISTIERLSPTLAHLSDDGG